MKHRGAAYILLFFCTPLFATASVHISEVAWMGTSADANHEWIELYNAGTDVTLDGWTLEADDGQPDIELSGVLQEGNFALLERTSDDTVTSVNAYLIYTGSLSNSGELLTLRDANGNVVDSVDGRDAWKIGGNNDTKETLQRSGTPPVGGWVTGAPTPQSSSYTETQQISSETDEETEPKRTTVGGNILYGSEREEEEQGERLEPALTITLGAQERTVVVGVPTTFLARGYTESGREIVLDDVMWNFGDGAQVKGREVTHTYWYTGEYMVSVVGKRGNFLRDVQDEATATVHVVDSPVQVVDANGTFITLKNESNKIVDISGCVLVSGDSHFTLPTRTQILGNATVRFPRKITGLDANGTMHMFDPHGALLATNTVVPKMPEKKVASVSYTPTQNTETTEEVTPEAVTEIQEEKQHPELLAVAGTLNTEPENTDTDTLAWWILALFTVIVTAIVAVLLVRHEQKEVIEGFYIESKKE